MKYFTILITQFTTLGQALEAIEALFLRNHLFFGHGTTTAWDEAVALCFYALNLPLDSTQEVLSNELTDEDKQKILSFASQRVESRLPLPYICKEAWFAGLAFYVDQRVLIPRSPIAECIMNQFSPWHIGSTAHILDMCTGSACIAIACAYYVPEAKVDAVDISPEALEVAKLNIAKHGMEERVRLIHSDLFAALQKNEKNNYYDIIISNPPYVGKKSMEQLPAEYRHEPTLALEAKENGLALVLHILQQAPAYLKEDGILIMEVGESKEALEACSNYPFAWIDFEQGGEGVFVLSKQELLQGKSVK